MKTDFSISPDRKIELQDEIIKNFEEEKVKLLDTISSLEFEKDFDQKMNHKSIDMAKELINTMEKQIKALNDATNEINRLKEQYSECINQNMILKQHYQSAIDELIAEIRSEVSLDNKPDKKKALLQKLNKRT